MARRFLTEVFPAAVVPEANRVQKHPFGSMLRCRRLSGCAQGMMRVNASHLHSGVPEMEGADQLTELRESLNHRMRASQITQDVESRGRASNDTAVSTRAACAHAIKCLKNEGCARVQCRRLIHLRQGDRDDHRRRMGVWSWSRPGRPATVSASVA